MIDSIGQEVKKGDLCILPWKSNKVTIGFYSHETWCNYIFTSKDNSGKIPITKSKLMCCRSIVKKHINHFIKVVDTETGKYIEV